MRTTLALDDDLVAKAQELTVTQGENRAWCGKRSRRSSSAKARAGWRGSAAPTLAQGSAKAPAGLSRDSG